MYILLYYCLLSNFVLIKQKIKMQNQFIINFKLYFKLYSN